MLLFAACLAIFVYGMVASMVGTINPALAATFQLNNVQTSYLALAQGIGLVVASVSVGPLMDRRGKKVGLVLGLTFVAAAMLVLASASGFAVILVAMIVMGMGGGIVITGANALGSDVSESRRASVLNFLNVFVGLGGFATPFVAGNLLGGDAVRVAYAAAALTIVTLLVHLVLRIPRPVMTGIARKSSAVFRQPMLYLLGSATFLYTACEFGVWNWLVKYLLTRGVEATTAFNVLSLGFALGLLSGRVAVTPILIKVPPATVTVSASILMALTTWAMLHVSDVTLLGAVVFLAGVAMAPVFPTTIAIVGDVFKEGSATAIGFTITCGFSGLVVSSPLIGWLAGPDPSGLGRGLLLLPAFSIALLVVNLVIRQKRAAVLAMSAPA
ncbi:MAG: MFS transporter [Acidobacteria bacterium]|nr:MFS transporter [Acidobacteriota bacterium]